MYPDRIDIIALFNKLSDSTTNKAKKARHKQNQKITHYVYEIIRNWNRLNIIFLNISKKIKKPPLEKTLGFFIIYRVNWEHATTKELLADISKILIKNNKKDFFLQNFIVRFINGIKKFSWEFLFSKLTPDAVLSLQTATPSFVIDRLKDHLPYEEIRSNLEMMYKPISDITHTLRLNEIKLDKATKTLIFKMLKANNIEVVADSHYDYLLVVPGKQKKAIVQNEFYQSGYLIFQNKASVVPIELLNPQAGDLIWDMCAAPGVKPNLISQKTGNKAKIIASDFNASRLSTMVSILRKLSSNNIFVILSDSITPPFRNDIKFDKILLDPPCTGSGTFSSSPELKWRQNFSFLNQNVALQEMLLQSSVNYLKKEGILVYSTCSLYFEEGEAQIQKILEQFTPIMLPNWISKSYQINGTSLEGMGRLFPSIHHSQGFFIAKLKKN